VGVPEPLIDCLGAINEILLVHCSIRDLVGYNRRHNIEVQQAHICSAALNETTL
jgi:hypothetical protein